MIRTLLAAALLLGASIPARASDFPVPPVPAGLSAHLHDGSVDPDDIDWLRGAFPGADDAQQGDWLAIEAWITDCFDKGTALVRDELAALGVKQVENGGSYAAPLCVEASMLVPPPDARAVAWESYLAANGQAKRAWDIFFYGARFGFESAPFDPAWAPNDDARTLLRATVREQIYRRAFGWGVDGPALPPDVLALLERRIGLAVTQEDHKNTMMLKAMVDRIGWPTIQGVGARASDNAWLLVQHADQDPLFQYRALKLMEPLVATGGVKKENYAYLYDRVMLKLAGTRRYGTQVQCRNGVRAPLPIEPGITLDVERAKMDMGPHAAYLAFMDENFGACPA